MHVSSLLLAPVLASFVVLSAPASPARAHARSTRHTLVRPFSAQDADGKALYLKNCKQCHGVTGEPTKTAKRQYEKIASLNDAEFMKQLTTKVMLDVVRKGKGEMKGFADKMTAAEMEAVVAYTQTLSKSGG
ncbi:MAG: cytochrome c [Gemmatimonadetes bacterium]|nr:cytochrome c [Gemmatimonadota bacterium]